MKQDNNRPETMKKRREAVTKLMKDKGKKFSNLDEIVEELGDSGEYTSKATLGRDLKALNYVKKDKFYVYDPAINTPEKEKADKLQKFIRVHTLKILCPSANTIVLKTSAATGKAVAYRLKKLLPDKIFGTITDDNMVMVFLNENEDSKLLLKALKKIKPRLLENLDDSGEDDTDIPS